MKMYIISNSATVNITHKWKCRRCVWFFRCVCFLYWRVDEFSVKLLISVLSETRFSFIQKTDTAAQDGFWLIFHSRNCVRVFYLRLKLSFLQVHVMHLIWENKTNDFFLTDVILWGDCCSRLTERQFKACVQKNTVECWIFGAADFIICHYSLWI